MPVGTWISTGLTAAAVGSEATDWGGSLSIVRTKAPTAKRQSTPRPLSVLREGVIAEAAFRKDWPWASALMRTSLKTSETALSAAPKSSRRVDQGCWG